MEPGYTNLQEVKEGELLAHDHRGEILAREKGRVLMPLYQGLGDDGFFLAREVKPFWLKLSAFLRRLHLDAIVNIFPGVKHHPKLENTFLVNPKIARWFVIEIFHLLGFRKHKPEAGMLVLSKRKHDLRPSI